MAIAFDATAGANTGAPATSYTYAHTCIGSNRLLFVGCMVALFTDSISGVTYNGTSLTFIAGAAPVAGYYARLYYLIAPSTGANNVVISSSLSGFIFGKSASYTGASQTGVPDGSTTGTTAGTSYTTTLSSTADNCWAVLYDAGDRQPVASTGSTLRTSGPNDGIFDSNSAKTPAGSISMSLTRASGGGQGQVMATFAPYTSASTLSVKVGTYTGDGATSGTRAITGIGFQPKFLFVWSADTTEIYPAYSYQSAITGLGSNIAYWGENGWSTGTTADRFQSFDSDGFTIACGSGATATLKALNKNAITFYYLALGGTDVYSGTYTGNATDNRSITGVGFEPAFVWTMGGSDHSFFKDSGSGSSTDTSSSPYNVADVANGIQALEADGFQVGTYNTGSRTVNVSGRVYYYVAIKASADFYSGQYTGNGSDNRDITAPGFQPNYIWIKGTSTQNSVMRSSDMAGDASKYYHSSGFATDRVQSFISTGFQVGTAAEVNTNTSVYNYFTLKAPAAATTFIPAIMMS